MDKPRAYLAAHPEALFLYAVTDSSWLAGRRLEDCVAAAVAGGASFIQLREKGMPTDELSALARRVHAACPGLPFVVNDDVDAAVASGADGVHVGQEDEAARIARARIGEDRILGVSVQTVEQALAAQAAGADYLGVGALFKTATKAEAADVSIATLSDICAATSIPVVAIGGLNLDTIGVLKGTGARGAAVVSAVFASQDPRDAASELSRSLRNVI